MSFHLTAEDIVIEDNHILKAQLRNEDDELVESTIDLNEHLGNNGAFEWDGENFSESAENVEFSIEGDGEVPVLRALLGTGDDEPAEADINLSEHIVNENGQFVYQ
ncbi:CVNH domain-containing protein [Aspergillus ruber CBS 135680]|uniref:Cyanovirin-N n=1 Tax=Aspergillus ruber (strain CBS 135680) TaxID=1388766 RepID=A0A017S9G2_ASPRC|nr:Cyanovirin-N [Aspergillus ruber CBS 135680]EYE93683.1 Cyanovirin-N [Aspergillus ruber CBS 135680]